MKTNPVHSASQQVEFIKAHALEVVDPPDGASVDTTDAGLEVTFSSVTRGDHGEEGLRMVFPITTPPGCPHIVHKQGLERFVNPHDSKDEVIAARGPREPQLMHVKTLRTTRTEEGVLDPAGDLDQSGWASRIATYLLEVREHLPPRCVRQMASEYPFTDEGQLENAKELLVEDLRYFHWSVYDNHFVAEFDGDGVLTISEVVFDDYLPAQVDELYEMIREDLEAWFDRARQVQYQYNPRIGWEFRFTKDEEWQTV